MRPIVPALALLAVAALAAPAAAITLPDPMNLPAPPIAPVSQCLGSTTVVHTCVGVVHGLPRQQDATPPAVGTPSAVCTPAADPAATGRLVNCDASVDVNGRINAVHVHLDRGLPTPATPALPALPA